ncbi:Ribosomal silencing factor RsfS [Fundidesulfovibrio magnetotacticus]|uniref:Ribosomal silencing factor RsfS n=1 Tax=Fundidesulfovibrio magnetotacticus TaxID=2730080 RepID=A0A6V8LZU1_9BACT|nr:ribosome silencing factor [Fundidesulfovibrio magnetotacticus]GFK95539.1 Ribosomal silencing factor RsfS [Fundidesulfovibrio magnetotacticus]
MTIKKKAPGIPTVDKVRLVAEWLLEKKAADLVAFDVSRLCTVTEAMIVATAANVRQAQALADHVLARCGEEQVPFLGMDGFKTGQWILVDLNDVLVHIFQEDARQFYNIEGLWAEGAPIALPDAAKVPAGTPL